MQRFIRGLVVASLLLGLDVGLAQVELNQGQIWVDGILVAGGGGGATTNDIAKWAQYRAMHTVIPSASNQWDLGTEALPWHDIYVSSNSIHFVGGSNTVNLTGSDVASLKGDVPPADLKPVYAQTPTNALESNAVVTVDFMRSVQANQEGMQRLGTVGGYTLAELLSDTYPRGPSRDKPQFVYGDPSAFNRAISWSDGDVYDPPFGYYHLASGNTMLTDNAVNYAYWNSVDPTIVKWTTTRPDVESNIVLGVFSVALGTIMQGATTEAVGDMPLDTRAAAAAIAPSLIVNGMEYYATGTALSNIVKTAGVEYHDMRTKVIHPTQNLSTPQTPGIQTFGHTNVGVWGWALTNQFPVGLWDTGSNIVACTTTNWYRGTFLSFAGDPFMAYVYPQQAYTSEVAAIAGEDPVLPPGFTPYVPICTAYVFLGNDTTLRTDSQDWVDRRFQIRRHGTVTPSSGSSAIPSLDQVMLKGASLGGILPRDAGLPTLSHQLASKGYVDASVNNINQGRVYVDQYGNDATAHIQDSIHPFLTIQAAITAAASVAQSTNRFVVTVSPGQYTEDVTMHNYVGIAASDTESTVLNGSVTYPKAFDDTVGAELQMLTISTVNRPAVTIDMGDTTAYAGIRACYIKALYDNNAAQKSLMVINKGICEIYGTTYHELTIAPTNGSEASQNVQIYEATDDPANVGASSLFTYQSSCIIACDDENDDVALLLTHANTSQDNLNTIESGIARIDLSTPSLQYSNRVMLVHNKTAQGTTRCQDKVAFVTLNPTNSCRVMWGYNSASGAGGSSIAVKDCGITILGQDTAQQNVYWGAATTSNDTLKVFNSTYVNSSVMPAIFTNNGSLGTYAVNAPLGNGDHQFGGAIDMANLNTVQPSVPAAGHIKLYVDSTSGFERPYFIDSRGNYVRIGRDSVLTVHNAETNTLQPGEIVYIAAGIDGTSHYVKRAQANGMATMPCFGMITGVGGIAAGSRGMLLRFGRAEYVMDTSMWTPGDRLYVSTTVPGGITNVKPSGTNIAQAIGWCNVSATNGSINVETRTPDLLGGLTPGSYVLHTAADEQLAWTAAQSNAVQYVLGRTSVWDSVAAYQQQNSNGVAYLLGRTNQWDATYLWVAQTSNTLAVRTSVWDRAAVDATLWTNWAITHTTAVDGVIASSQNWNTVYSQWVLHTNDTQYMLDRTNAWDAAYLWTSQNSNSVATLYGRTSVWDAAYLWTSQNSNSVATMYGRTSVWDSAAGWVQGSSNDSVYVESRTNLWNSAYDWVNQNSNTLAGLYGRTSTWDSASSWIALNSNGTQYLLGRSNAWNQAGLDGTTATNYLAANTGSIAYVLGRSNAWNQAGVDAASATNYMKLNTNELQYLMGRSNAWNQAGVDAAAATNYLRLNTGDIAYLLGRSNSWNQASLDASTATNYLTQHTNGLEYVLARTSQWDAVVATARFKAGLATNIALANTTAKFPMTNVMMAASGGSVYDATNARWTPKTTNHIVELRGGFDLTNVQNGVTVALLLYKNGALYSTVTRCRSPANGAAYANTWAYYDTVNTNANDYYEVFYQSSGTPITTGAMSNCWWYGDSKP